MGNRPASIMRRPGADAVHLTSYGVPCVCFGPGGRMHPDARVATTHEGIEAWTGNHEFWQSRLSSLGIHDGIPWPLRAMECLWGQALRLKRYSPRAQTRSDSRKSRET